MISIRARILSGVLFLAFVALFGLLTDWYVKTPIDTGRILYHVITPIPAAFVVDWMTVRRKRRELEAKQGTVA
jgi:uncharacterized membrane protein